MLPPDFDPCEAYPVLVHVYGEPAGQTVVDRWGGGNHLWHRMLAQNGYVVMSFDNRGTPAPRGPGLAEVGLSPDRRPGPEGPGRGRARRLRDAAVSSTPSASASGAGAAAAR